MSASFFLTAASPPRLCALSLHDALPICEAAAGCDIVFCCVGNDDDLRSVVLGADGALAGMKPGAIFVDHTTASDRKSTRLNSSHGYISYAVFCLKKKNRTTAWLPLLRAC